MVMVDQFFLASLHAEQLRLHAAAFKGALVGSALLGLVLAVMLRNSIEHKLLGLWLACLALALGTRVVLLWWQRRGPQGSEPDPSRLVTRLAHLRATFLLHGLVWCAAAVVFLPRLGQVQADLLVLALVAICVGSIINTTFDPWACTLFSLPSFLFLARHFAAAGDGAATSGIIVAGFVAVVALSAARDWRKLRRSVMQREHDASALRDADRSLRIYAAAANSIDDMLSVAGEDEVYRMVNEAWCRRTGIARGQIVGKRLLDLLPNAFDPVRRPAIVECLERQAPFVVTGAVAMPSLSGRILQTTYYPYGEDEAGIRCVAMVTRDITEQENSRTLLARQADYLNRTLDTTGEGIFAVDAGEPGAPLRFINQRMLDMFGLAREDAEAFTPAELARRLSGFFVDAPAEARRIAAIIATQSTQEDLLELRDGRVLLRRCTPAEEGLSKVRVWSFRDITERKRGELALIAARDEAERANRAKSQFLSHMSHELRTPLNAILGFAQLLESDERVPLAASHRAYTREILLGGRHLLALINDALDLGGIESGRLAVQCTALPLLPVVQDCLRLVQAIAYERQIELVPPQAADFDVQVLADSTRLKQVLLNLLGNAIKYNHPGGSVALEARLEGQSLRLQVRDTGAGLTAEQQLHLFEPFERLGAEERGVEGSGIGLALSRRIMHAMGGEIGAHSSQGAGSIFWIRLLRPAQVPLEMTRLMDTVRGGASQNPPC